jgi:hypothetical protein
MKLTALILILLAPSFSWAENYLCITDKSTGFIKKETGDYEITKFAEEKYIISTEDKTLSLFGEKVLNRDCSINSERVACHSKQTDFNMHRDNLLFMVYHKTYGYVWGNVNDTPNIAIGTCSEF